MLKFCVENVLYLKKSMSYAFSIISHVGEMSGQNRCASGTRNIESNTHGLSRLLRIFAISTSVIIVTMLCISLTLSLL
jgi:hypothetical protein